MYSVVITPTAARDVRRLRREEQRAVQRTLTSLKANGIEAPRARRVIQTGRPGLFSIPASDELRLFASQLDERTIGLFAVAPHRDFDRIISAAREAATKLPEEQLYAAAAVLQNSIDIPDKDIHCRLQKVAPEVVDLAESSLKRSPDWSQISAIGTWVGVIISLIALLVAVAEREPDQNIYINVEQLFEQE